MTFRKNRSKVLHLGQGNSVAQPEKQLCRQGPAKAWLSLSQSTALQQGELRDGHRSTGSWPRGATPQLPATTGRGQQPGRDLPVPDRHQETGVSSLKGHQDSHRLEHLPCEDSGCWAPSACRRDSFRMRTKIAACCYRDVTKRTDPGYLVRCKVGERKN